MNNDINSALSASAETASIEFKESFNTDSAQDWAEIVKDIIAIANSGGGIIVFGLTDDGEPAGHDLTDLEALDSAKIADKIYKYTLVHFTDFLIHKCEKSGHRLVALIIRGVSIPIVFQKAGTYDVGDGKQKTAFSAGTVYFRHGAKSEPGTTEDLRRSFERYLESVRNNWLENIRQVVEAPLGSRIITLSPDSDGASLTFRPTYDPSAPAIGGLNPDHTHPYRMTELVEEINQRLPEETRINKHDVLCIRKLYDIDTNTTFHFSPKFGGHQYSLAFVNWIIEQFEQDAQFFERARREYYNRRKTTTSS